VTEVCSRKTSKHQLVS